MKIGFKFFIVFSYLLLGHEVFSQCESIQVSGRVIDTLNNSNFYYSVIYNKTKEKAFFGNADGTFQFKATNNDSIIISVNGYPKEFFKVEGKDCRFQKTVFLKFISKKLKPIILRPIRTAAEIKEERSRLALKTSRTVTGAEILQSPITFLYEAFSQKERNKRWLAEQRYKDRQDELISEYLRNCIMYKLISLDVSEIEQFRLFLNLDPDFFKLAADYELALHIKRVYDLYVLEKK